MLKKKIELTDNIECLKKLSTKEKIFNVEF
jgi:hypothetical protein